VEPEKNDPCQIPSAPQIVVTTDTAQYRFLREPKPVWATAIDRDKFGLFVVIQLANTWQKMRWIPPGRFVMGSPRKEPFRTHDEVQHLVTLTEGFWLAETACPRAVWEAVVGDAAGWYLDRWNPDLRINSPVRSLTWYDCQLFLEKAESRCPGLRLRLPTEAEWEYACRAGTTTAFSFGDDVTAEQVRYFRSHSSPRAVSDSQYSISHNCIFPLPVKSLPPNPWGLYEMHGNVWEWCADWFGPYPEDKVRDPKGPTFGTMRILRGGSHDDRREMARSARRGWYYPGQQLGNFAFRFARNA
jgi:sulfatase modifying factor 1